MAYRLFNSRYTLACDFHILNSLLLFQSLDHQLPPLNKIQKVLTTMPKSYEPKRKPLDPCPIETVINMVGGKWKARALYLLTHESYGFADLRRALGKVSQQVLSTQLQALESNGLVRREAPLPEESHYGLYSATDKGIKLVKLLLPVAEWGAKELENQGLEWDDPTKHNSP